MEDADWELLSHVKRSSYRRRILEYLYDVAEPRTPSEIASKLEISRNHVSRALAEIGREDDAALVEVINPEAHYDRRYRITERGRMIVEKLQEIEEE